MSTISVSREIPASVSEVWAVLADFGGIHRYNASVERSPINKGTPPSGVGSERTCQLYDGNHLQERIVESIEERKLTIDIFESSMPLKSAQGVMTLEPLSPRMTRITTSMEYDVKYGPVGVVLDRLMVKRMLEPGLNMLLAGLDHHVMTGETIGEGWKPDSVKTNGEGNGSA